MLGKHACASVVIVGPLQLPADGCTACGAALPQGPCAQSHCPGHRGTSGAPSRLPRSVDTVLQVGANVIKLLA